MAMSSDKKTGPSGSSSDDDHAKPAWAGRLKRMYDEVVSEQLPDELEALLRKLDETGDKH